jgi:HSP20 family molecular chaperone IbpA
MDLAETDDQLVLKADLPGLDKDDVEAEFDKGVLVVRIPKPAEPKPHRVPIGATVNGEAQKK